MNKSLLRSASIIATVGGFVVLLLSLTEYGESGKLGVLNRKLETLRSLDSFLEQPSGRTYHADGRLAYDWQADRANRLNNGVIELIHPTYQGIGASNNRWIARAQQGLFSADGQQLELNTKVRIEELRNNALINSETFKLDLNNNTLTSDQFVRFLTPTSTTTATGMIASMDGQRLEFLSDVRGSYEAP